MDTLSQLIALSQLQVELDARCLLSGEFAIGHQPLPREEAAFHFMLTGRCRLNTNQSDEITLQSGDFVLLPQGSAHGLSAIPEHGMKSQPVRPVTVQPANPLSGHALAIKSNSEPGVAPDVDLLCGRFKFTAGAGILLTQAMPTVIQVNLYQLASGEPVKALAGLLRSEAATRQPGAHSLVNALGQVLLVYALRAYSQENRILTGLLTLAADARLSIPVQAMLAAPGEPWTIARLGEKAAMSRATFARRFQDAAGMTVGECLLQIRMMHACELLSRTQQSQASIAEAVGYQSEAAFGKVFSQVMGATPGRWRRALKQEEAMVQSSPHFQGE